MNMSLDGIMLGNAMDDEEDFRRDFEDDVGDEDLPWDEHVMVEPDEDLEPDEWLDPAIRVAYEKLGVEPPPSDGSAPWYAYESVSPVLGPIRDELQDLFKSQATFVQDQLPKELHAMVMPLVEESIQTSISDTVTILQGHLDLVDDYHNPVWGIISNLWEDINT
jgi:hypothetical protein